MSLNFWHTYEAQKPKYVIFFITQYEACHLKKMQPELLNTERQKFHPSNNVPWCILSKKLQSADDGLLPTRDIGRDS